MSPELVSRMEDILALEVEPDAPRSPVAYAHVPPYQPVNEAHHPLLTAPAIRPGKTMNIARGSVTSVRVFHLLKAR